jgi:hypothetical protein
LLSLPEQTKFLLHFVNTEYPYFLGGGSVLRGKSLEKEIKKKKFFRTFLRRQIFLLVNQTMHLRAFHFDDKELT